MGYTNKDINNTLGKLEESLKNIKESVDKIDSKLEGLEERFITRAEFAVFKWVISTLIAVAGLAISLSMRVFK